MQVSCKSKSQSYTQWKWPENALQWKQSHCTTHTRDEENGR